jgi:hypothetical protein
MNVAKDEWIAPDLLGLAMYDAARLRAMVRLGNGLEGTLIGWPGRDRRTRRSGKAKVVVGGRFYAVECDRVVAVRVPFPPPRRGGDGRG